MTKKLEEFFHLTPTEETPVTAEEQPPKTKEELFAEADTILNALTTAEKVDHALPTVTGLDAHDVDMDDIADKAIKTYQDLLVTAGNTPDMHAGKMYEVAGQMLKTALDAKNAKAEKKLRMIELQLKKIRAEQNDPEGGNGKSKTGEFDRNEILKYIIDNKPQNSDK